MNQTKALAFLCRHQPLSDSVRYWVRQAAMAFADASLVAGVVGSLRSAGGGVRGWGGGAGGGWLGEIGSLKMGRMVFRLRWV